MPRFLLIICASLVLGAAGCGGGQSTADPTTRSAAEPPPPPGPKPKVEAPGGRGPRKLVVKDLAAGNGEEARRGDEVGIEYFRVDFYDGKLYDTSTWDEGEPWHFTIGAGEAVPGLEQGVEGMEVGGRRELIIPPKLGFGAQRVGVIKPHSTLVFVVDLVEVG